MRLTIAIFALTAAANVGWAQVAPGGVGYPPSPVFGMLGVTVFQTVRLNVVAYPPGPVCTTQLSFADKNGKPVGTAKSVSLSDGQATFLDLPGGDVVKAFGARAEVHPIVTVPPQAGALSACVASVEVIDNIIGGTAVYYPPGPI